MPAKILNGAASPELVSLGSHAMWSIKLHYGEIVACFDIAVTTFDISSVSIKHFLKV
ncbi:MAG: hypothetical protein NTZ02_00245 [Candidatus Woesearchaeota archaeon]|nr:hypothetical protein [Candidatus Woesearchaeota archaeon]